MHRMEGDRWQEVVDGTASLKDRDIGVLIIDPISATYAGKVKDENSNSDIYEHLNDIRETFSRVGITVIYAHHHTKSGPSGDTVNSGSGAGAFARVGTAFMDMEELVGDLRVRFKSRSFKQLTTIAVRPIEVIDDEGEPCAIAFEWEALKSTEDRIRDDITAYLSEHGETKKTQITVDVKGNKQTVAKVMDDMAEAGLLDLKQLQGRGNPTVVSLPPSVAS